jgi:hypothetical protein
LSNGAAASSSSAPVNVGFDGSAPAPDAPKPVREIPPWLVAVVVLGCVAGAGWFLWTNWLRSGPAERIVILDRGPDDGVKSPGGGRFDVRSGNAALTCTKTPDGKDAELQFKWAKQEYLTPEQIKVLTVVFRVAQDPGMAAEMKVTPEQLVQLKENRAKAKVELPERDRDRLKSLFLAYDAEKEKDAKHKAESKLIKALDAVAAELEGPAKQLAAERTAHAQAVLSPEQFQRFDATAQ